MGAGATGKRLARALIQHGVQMSRFVDIDPLKIGGLAQGVPVVSKQALDVERDLVLVAVGARGARELVRAELSARGFVDGESAWFAA